MGLGGRDATTRISRWRARQWWHCRSPGSASAATERRLLYIAAPGIRNYVSYGGVGILVYDIGDGYKFVKRIPTWNVPPDQQPENVKGIEASARTGMLYVSTMKRLGCIDLVSEKMVWERELEGGCDRMALSPDGSDSVRSLIRGAALECRQRRNRRHDREGGH